VTRFGTLVERVDERGRGVDLPLMSVSQSRGVIRRSELTTDLPRADSLDDYKICRRGDIVFNKMSIRDGAMGVAREDGLVTYHYEVMRPKPRIDPRYVAYLMKSEWFRGELIKLERGIGIGGTSGVRTTEVPFSVLRTIDGPVADPRVQHRVADYLDDETARIDALVRARRQQRSLIDERLLAAIWNATTKGIDAEQMRPSGIDWVGEVPAHWGTPTVGTNFHVQLGKMLTADGSSSGEQSPYLRNVNVQWDRIDTGDLKTMHFDPMDRIRYRLRSGDLLVCEGGEVGRAAVWSGELDGCYYQKALHRLRPLGAASVRFLMYALWAAASRGVFSNEGNTSTIVHLTAEQLRAHRLPWPPLDEQNEIVAGLDALRQRVSALTTALESQVDLLLERRQSLITAAVTGQIEIPGFAA